MYVRKKMLTIDIITVKNVIEMLVIYAIKTGFKEFMINS